jgi:hypothetical protein
MAQQRAGAREESHDGYEKELADYESELARYLQARIKPGLSRGAIPLLARSIAREIAGGRRRPNRSRAATPRRPEVARLQAGVHARAPGEARRRLDPALLGPWRGRLADRRESRNRASASRRPRLSSW